MSSSCFPPKNRPVFWQETIRIHFLTLVTEKTDFSKTIRFLPYFRNTKFHRVFLDTLIEKFVLKFLLSLIFMRKKYIVGYLRMFSKTLKKISIYCIASIGMCVVYACILFIWSTSDKEKKVFSGAIHNLRHPLSRGRVDLQKGDVTP